MSSPQQTNNQTTIHFFTPNPVSRIHGTGIIYLHFYHKKSTLHVGKYTIFPWIRHGKKLHVIHPKKRCTPVTFRLLRTGSCRCQQPRGSKAKEELPELDMNSWIFSKCHDWRRPMAAHEFQAKQVALEPKILRDL